VETPYSDDYIEFAAVGSVTAQSPHERAIRDNFDQAFGVLAQVRDQYSDPSLGSSPERTFNVYRDALAEIETYVRTGEPVDVKGLWTRAQYYPRDWESDRWMQNHAPGAESFSTAGVFHGSHVAGIDVDLLVRVATSTTNPDPTQFERAAAWTRGTLESVAIFAMTGGIEAFGIGTVARTALREVGPAALETTIRVEGRTALSSLEARSSTTLGRIASDDAALVAREARAAPTGRAVGAEVPAAAQTASKSTVSPRDQTLTNSEALASEYEAAGQGWFNSLGADLRAQVSDAQAAAKAGYGDNAFVNMTARRADDAARARLREAIEAGIGESIGGQEFFLHGTRSDFAGAFELQPGKHLFATTDPAVAKIFAERTIAKTGGGELGGVAVVLPRDVVSQLRTQGHLTVRPISDMPSFFEWVFGPGAYDTLMREAQFTSLPSRIFQ